jgi:hypothetical protein
MAQIINPEWIALQQSEHPGSGQQVPKYIDDGQPGVRQQEATIKQLKADLDSMDYQGKWKEFENFVKNNPQLDNDFAKRKLNAITSALHATQEDREVTRSIEKNMGFEDIQSSRFMDARFTRGDYERYAAFRDQMQWDKALSPEYMDPKLRAKMNKAYEPMTLDAGESPDEKKAGSQVEPGATGRTSPNQVNANVKIPKRFQDISRQYSPTAGSNVLMRGTRDSGRAQDYTPGNAMTRERGERVMGKDVLGDNPFTSPARRRDMAGAGANATMAGGALESSGTRSLGDRVSAKRQGLLSGATSVDPAKSKLGLGARSGGLLGDR